MEPQAQETHSKKRPNQAMPTCGKCFLDLKIVICDSSAPDWATSHPSLFLLCCGNPAPLSQATTHVPSITQLFTQPLAQQQQQQQDWLARRRQLRACCVKRSSSNMSAGDAAPLGYAQRRAMQNSSPLRGSPSKRERVTACSGSCNTHCPGTAAPADTNNMEAQVGCRPSNNCNLAQQHQH